MRLVRPASFSGEAAQRQSPWPRAPCGATLPGGFLPRGTQALLWTPLPSSGQPGWAEASSVRYQEDDSGFKTGSNDLKAAKQKAHLEFQKTSEQLRKQHIHPPKIINPKSTGQEASSGSPPTGSARVCDCTFPQFMGTWELHSSGQLPAGRAGSPLSSMARREAHH